MDGLDGSVLFLDRVYWNNTKGTTLRLTPHVFPLVIGKDALQRLLFITGRESAKSLVSCRHWHLLCIVPFMLTLILFITLSQRRIFSSRPNGITNYPSLITVVVEFDKDIVQTSLGVLLEHLTPEPGPGILLHADALGGLGPIARQTGWISGMGGFVGSAGQDEELSFVGGRRTADGVGWHGVGQMWYMTSVG